ncbi:MAG TPA: response regulator transcription factor [Acidimicrobiia bacterium]
MRLLIVEDEPDLASALARGLRRRGHGVDVVGTVAQAELAVASTGFDLLVIDWNLPDGAGIDICRRVVNGDLATLEGTRPKILMLTARDAVEDRVEGLDAGADDYLVKPFAFAELEARLRALFRRDTDSSPVLRAGEIELDPARFEVHRGGRSIDLTAKEFALLEYFMRHSGQVLSQERLLEHVWDEMVDPFTNTVRVTISNLRRKLGDPAVIDTVPGRGYVLRE